MTSFYHNVQQNGSHSEKEKLVISVFGGSGVGKSEIASLLALYFNRMGIGCYVLSGDNYPHRIPVFNDAERVRIFRTVGLKKLVGSGQYNNSIRSALEQFWSQETDAAPEQCAEYPWLATYQAAGRDALRRYLGTRREQDYTELNGIIRAFKRGSKSLFLKRMGRVESERWYSEVSFAQIRILIVEWTHGGSPALHGVDIPVFLNSTPEETREHRRSRARDGKTDSAFTTMVLEIEQEKLSTAAEHARITVSKSGVITLRTSEGE